MQAFYGVSAGAAATLVGLLFVAVQIGPPLATGGPVGRRHAMARSTFTIFAVIFALSLFFTTSLPTPRLKALVAIAAATIGGIRAVRTWIPVWRDKLHGRIEFRLWQTAWLLIGPVLTYIYLAFGSLQQLGSNDPKVIDFYAANVFIILFVVGLRNSWSLLVEATPS
ncbi:MAG TPA: hypothetical protein VHK65_14260 [Candidatus Dormibacteraeota bacterium]|nr:hypothetical protein [Candidatus Dormibacteraeota bacterium]